MAYPINYDFGNKWRTQVIPHLDNPKIKKAIRKGINSYLKMFPLCKKTYKPNTPPANYSSRDAYMMTMDKKWKYMYRALLENNMVPKKILNLEKKMDECSDYDDDDEYGDKLFQLKMAFEEQFFTWEDIKNDLESYYVSGACFWWAPTFELELAKLVEPNEKWHVQESDIHATVINEDETRVFDLLYWADYERMDNYLFGTKIKKHDLTLGGKNAYLDSL